MVNIPMHIRKYNIFRSKRRYGICIITYRICMIFISQILKVCTIGVFSVLMEKFSKMDI